MRPGTSYGDLSLGSRPIVIGSRTDGAGTVIALGHIPRHRFGTHVGSIRGTKRHLAEVDVIDLVGVSDISDISDTSDFMQATKRHESDVDMEGARV